MPLLPPAPKLMFPFTVSAPNRCTKALLLVAKSKLPFTVVLDRLFAALVVNTSAVFGSVLIVPSSDAPFTCTWPPFDAVIRLFPLLVSVPATETTLPAPAALMAALLVMLLFKLSVAPFVASAVPVLMKLLLLIVSGAAAEFALTVPLFVNTEPLLYSATLPKPTKLPLRTRLLVLLSRWMPLLPPAPKLMLPFTVSAPYRCTKPVPPLVRSKLPFTVVLDRLFAPLVLNTSDEPDARLTVPSRLAPITFSVPPVPSSRLPVLELSVPLMSRMPPL